MSLCNLAGQHGLELVADLLASASQMLGSLVGKAPPGGAEESHSDNGPYNHKTRSLAPRPCPQRSAILFPGVVGVEGWGELGVVEEVGRDRGE